MSDRLIREVREAIRRDRLFLPGESVLLGVSGGADSVCLTDVLCALSGELRIRLAIVHVNHGIRETAGRDAAFVQKMAEEKGIPFYLEQVDVPSLKAQWHCSEEDAARRARYEAFRRVMERSGAYTLALAHHRDDQAETLLLHLCRGAGLRGMAGMAPIREMEGAVPPAWRIVRPLLAVSRSEIEEYLADRGLAHVEDETNESDAYARNRVRRHLIPCAEEIHPGASAHLAEATERVREALAWIDIETQRQLAACRIDGAAGSALLEAAGPARPVIVLSTPILRQQHSFLQGEILLAALKEVGLATDIGERHLTALKQLIAADAGTHSLDLPGDFRAVRRYDRLYLYRGDRETPSLPHAGTEKPPRIMDRTGHDFSQRLIERTPGTPFDRSEIPTDPFTKWFDFDKIKQSVCIRTRRKGDWIDTGGGRKTLKKEMIDGKVPADERDRIPLLAAGEEILWIVGVRRSEAYRVTAETARILEVRYVPSHRR
ncbi:MAG: tRNA lysidine(34) synthetase TilS [Lachnospiraceae bacterium]|nr:tRNA lysidine(34) synthetase TilS [Lachnospiraceae bacterium]